MFIARVEDLIVDRAADPLERQGAIDIDKRASEWQQSGWTGYDPNLHHLRSTQLSRDRRETRTRVPST
jgi:hypothetical protein